LGLSFMMANMSADGAANSPEDGCDFFVMISFRFQDGGKVLQVAMVSMPAGMEPRPNPPSKSLPRPTCLASRPSGRYVHLGGQGGKRNAIAPILHLPAGFQKHAKWHDTDDGIARNQPFDDILRKQAVAVVAWQERGCVSVAGDNGPSKRSRDCRADNSSMWLISRVNPSSAIASSRARPSSSMDPGRGAATEARAGPGWADHAQAGLPPFIQFSRVAHALGSFHQWTSPTG